MKSEEKEQKGGCWCCGLFLLPLRARSGSKEVVHNSVGYCMDGNTVASRNVVGRPSAVMLKVMEQEVEVLT